MNNKISVIIPCFNSKTTIFNTLKSLFQQTIIDQIEIIVVDGGSTDGTYEELKKYNNKINLLQTKKGVPGQLSLGIHQAKGAYIGFLDSDDYIDPLMYEILFKNLKAYKCDVSVCKVFISNEFNRYIKNEHEIITTEIKDPYIRCRASRFNKLYRREILLKVAEVYNSSIDNVLWEDTIFAFLLYSLTNKIVDTNQYLYYYCQRADSYSRKEKYDEDYINKLNTLCHSYNLIYQKYKNPLYYRLYINPFQSIYYYCLSTRLKRLFFIKRKTMYKKIRNSFCFTEVLSKCRFDDSTKCMAERKDVTFKDYKRFLNILSKNKYFRLDIFLLLNGLKKIVLSNSSLIDRTV